MEHHENDIYIEKEGADLSDLLAQFVPESIADSHAEAVQYAYNRICELTIGGCRDLARMIVKYGWPETCQFTDREDKAASLIVRWDIGTDHESGMCLPKAGWEQE